MEQKQTNKAVVGILGGIVAVAGYLAAMRHSSVPVATNALPSTAPSKSSWLGTAQNIAISQPVLDPQAAADVVIEMASQPAVDVDERLFLLRALDDLRRQVPFAEPNPVILANRLAELRHSATKLQLHIRNKGVDKTLAELFGDFIAALDTYTQFLVDIQRINKESVADAERALAETGINAVQRGVEASQFAKGIGSSNNHAAGVGIVAAIVSASFDAHQKDQALRDSRNAAIEQGATRVANAFSAFEAHAEIVAAELTSTYGWKRGEAGFDDSNDLKASRLTRTTSILTCDQNR